MIYQFQPILKQTIWGGDKIAALKNLTHAPAQIGESWEISGIEGSVSVVTHGDDKGLSLKQLIDKQRQRLMGQHVYDRFHTDFPLLIKLIDAREDLSIQVHPDDHTARLHGHRRGKTEMWYVLPSDADASLRVGWRHALTPEAFLSAVEAGTICDEMIRYHVVAGDCFFLPAGRVHSIGAGCLLVEIQQTSDVTYRIYDFDRRDANGQRRELHTRLAAECIDYGAKADYQTHYSPVDNRPVTLADCPYFTTSLWCVDRKQQVDFSARDSFVILICTDGRGTITEHGRPPHTVAAGDTLLIAADTGELEIDGNLRFVETYVR